MPKTVLISAIVLFVVSECLGSPDELRRFELTVVGPDGKPVPSLPIAFQMNPPLNVWFEDAPDGGAPSVVVKTNAAGRAAIELPADVKRLAYLIETPGFAHLRALRDAERTLERIPTTEQATLAPAWSVGGVVVDGQGKPIEGARVYPLMTDPSGWERREFRFGQHCRTDAQGKWRYDCVPISQSEFKVEVDHPQFAPERRALSRAECGLAPSQSPAAKIVLRPGITVSGKVLDDRGEPIAGALMRTRLRYALRNAMSGSDGVYHLRGCEPGISALVASANGRAMEARELWIGPDVKPVDFRLKPGRVVRIRVVDDKGRPCPGARVHFYTQRYADFEFDNLKREVDRDGVWEWREAPPETVTVHVEFPGGERSDNEKLVPGREDYLIKPPACIWVTGTVVDRATQRPIKRFRLLRGLRLGGDRDCSYESANYADDGRFQVRLNAQPYSKVIRIEADGFSPVVSRDITAGEKAASLRFELTAEQNIEGVVFTPTGQPAGGATMAVAVGESSFHVTNGEILGRSSVVDARQTDASGHFSFPPQDPGYYMVIIHSSGYAWFHPVPKSNRRKVYLDPWTRVEGTYHLGGRPLAGVPMSVDVQQRPLGDDGPEILFQSQTTTGPDGGFVFPRVLPGPGRIQRVLNWALKYGHTERESACILESKFPPGKVTRLEFGQNGRSVFGKLKPPPGFDRPVIWNFLTLGVGPESENGAAEHPTYQATVDCDGRFRVDDLPPGHYKMISLGAAFAPGHLAETPFLVPGEDVRPLNEPLDLGVLELQGESEIRRRPNANLKK
jgi:uncharacterized GH25 family protein